MRPTHVLEAVPPGLDADQLSGIARDLYGIAGAVRPLVSERDQNAVVTDADGHEWVLKVANAAEEPGVVEMEVAAVEHVAALDPGLPVPWARPTLTGDPIGRAHVGGSSHLVRLIPLLPGRNASAEELTLENVRAIGVVVARIGHALRGFFHPAAGRAIWWDQKRMPDLAAHAALVGDPARRSHLERVLARFGERVLPALPGLRAQVIHNDVTLDNLLLDADGAVSGIIDFGDMAHTALVLDVPATLQSLLRGRDDLFEVCGTFLAGYTSVISLEPEEGLLLADLLAGRMAQTILISAYRTRAYPDNEYIRGWAEPAWTLLDQLDAVGMEEAARRLADLALSPRTAPIRAEPDLAARRRRVLGSALESLSYRRPLEVVRGEGCWLIDADGRRYLDAYNNVPVVGHSHPRVVEAISRQAATLNTNTRYLYPSVVELAERLVATMPDGLDTVSFVNSGSEANDLAWRLATAATGGDAGIVTDRAYHGVTSVVADLSPSEWPRGEQPSGVEVIAAPNTYRGRYAGADPVGVAREEVAGAIERLAARDHRPAAIYLDSLFTADGIFTPPAAVVEAFTGGARAAGALYVADEVQSGHGRTGDDLWGFRAWSVTPDLVTLGKPMGNGHPVAAVITRAEIVDRFAAGTTFFSTFGGNPVACAAALAVLDVIDEEGLIDRAATLGARLRSGIGSLAERHPVIGDVRGRGLLVGVELVIDPDGREPASDLAKRAVEEMRERGVLIGTTGRHGNVLKIRPPLVIAEDEVDLIVSTLDEVLGSLGA